MRDHSHWPTLFGQVGLRPIGMDAGKVAFFGKFPLEGPHRESKTAMRPEDGSVLAFSHVSFATVRVQGPSEQIVIDLRVLSLRSVLSTSVKIQPLKGEYR